MKKTLIVILSIILLAFIYTRLDKAPAETAVSEELLDWKSEGSYFNYKGHDIFYQDTGNKSKKAILLLHGYPTSSYDWHLIWPELASDYRLITMDMLGFGFSDKPDTAYSISMQADIFEILLEDLEITNVNLVSHDYGDNVAQELLARNIERQQANPIKIESVTFLNGGLFPETHNPTTIQQLLASPVGGIVAGFTNQILFSNNFRKVFGPNTQPTEQELIDQWYIICHKEGYRIADRLTHASTDRANNRERWVGAMIKPEVPVLYISGQHDPVTGSETVERYLELVPNPNVVKLENAGHFPQLENPRKIVQLIKPHIGQ